LIDAASFHRVAILIGLFASPHLFDAKGETGREMSSENGWMKIRAFAGMKILRGHQENMAQLSI
jgi:hypothetical protein